MIIFGKEFNSKQEAIEYLNEDLTSERYFIPFAREGRTYSSIAEWQESGRTSRFIDTLISAFEIVSEDLNWDPLPMPADHCYVCNGTHQV